MDFSKRITQIHGNKISLLSEYINMRSPVELCCNICSNVYKTKAKTAIKSGCPKCSKHAKDLTYFINKSQTKHGDKYDYSKSVYINNSTDLIIICPEHGEFKQKPTVHYRSGCPNCVEKHSTKEEFVNKANTKHSNLYSYDKSLYVNSYTPVVITCNKHGEFTQRPSSHLQGYGCPTCGKENTKLDINELTQKLSSKYPQYDFNNLMFKDSQSPINIICNKHGNFKCNKPSIALKHLECPVCKREEYNESQIIKFKQISTILHDGKYDYSDSLYTKYHDNTYITCHEHGLFEQTVLNHLQGKGCPKCSQQATTSKPQAEIEAFIQSIANQTIISNTPILDKKHIDIYLPDIKLGIEVNGIYWHSANGGNPKNKGYHINKSKLGWDMGINIIHVLDTEWVQKQERIKSLLKSKLGLYDNRFYARKCTLKEIDNKNYKSFCNENHLQGYASASIRYGLFNGDELISIMSFSKSRFNNYDWEMIRYCCKLNTTVIGGSSKLFKYFTKNHIGTIVSFSDNRFFDGKMYEHLGFSLSHISDPNYFYFRGFNVNKTILESRVKYQKHKLCNILEFYDPLKTEKQNMLEHGFDYVWDCGNKVWVYTT